MEIILSELKKWLDLRNTMNKVAIEHHYFVNREDIAKTMTKQFAMVRSFSDFIEFTKIMESFGIGLYLEGKRRKYHAYSFSNMQYMYGNEIVEDEKYAHYLYSDGKSTGKCQWESLHKYIRVAV